MNPYAETHHGSFAASGQLSQLGCRLCLLLLLTLSGTASAAPPPVPGRQVKVAAICIGFGGNHDEKLKLALEHLEIAGHQHVDIACLPEEFAGTANAEPISGPTVNAVAALARKHRMYVICPLREQADSGQYNTAVLLDRQGQVAGQYRKVGRSHTWSAF